LSAVALVERDRLQPERRLRPPDDLWRWAPLAGYGNNVLRSSITWLA
jgi:hypothetical protein